MQAKRPQGVAPILVTCKIAIGYSGGATRPVLPDPEPEPGPLPYLVDPDAPVFGDGGD